MSKHIYIYSPSGAVRDKAAFKRGVQRLQALGHDVEVDEAALASHQRFAGDDDTRLAAIARAAASGADVALISRGGYGLTRILPRINYKAVAKSVERGTQWVGMSDFTALQLALMAKTGAQTWAGPSLVEGFGEAIVMNERGRNTSGPDEIMEACFDDMLQQQGEGTGWRQDKIATLSVASSSARTQPTSEFHIKNATLWGGNLAVLCSLVGTPYLPEVKGGVLFLEDIAEHPYRVERMLTQLLHAGILAKQKAVVLGQFTGYQLTPHDKGFKLASVVDWLQSQIKAPVLTNLPFGHVPTKVLLPVGAKVDVVCQDRDSLIVWGHI
jgi:muramoyltetrapeptide carboxypeptidase